MFLNYVENITVTSERIEILFFDILTSLKLCCNKLTNTIQDTNNPKDLYEVAQ